MKNITLPLLSFLTFMNFAGVRAQSADDIVNKHLDALGGKDKISKIKTIYIESTTEIMGTEAPTITYIIFGKGLKSELDFNGQKVVQCLTENGGWGINPLMGQTSPEAISADQVKDGQAQLQVGGPLFNYASKGSKLELEGREDVSGVSAYKIKLTTKDSIESTFYFDPTTYYILKTIGKTHANGQESEATISFSDYRKTDFGNVLPFAQQVILPQITLSIINKKIEVNKDIDPKIFDKPQ